MKSIALFFILTLVGIPAVYALDPKEEPPVPVNDQIKNQNKLKDFSNVQIAQNKKDIEEENKVLAYCEDRKNVIIAKQKEIDDLVIIVQQTDVQIGELNKIK